jgi:hypothetical protein
MRYSTQECADLGLDLGLDMKNQRNEAFIAAGGDGKTFAFAQPPAPLTALPFGIIDPDYARYYTLIRTTAWQCGYAIGLHGSFTRDLDLIAVPWTAQALPPDLLIKQLEYRTDLRRQEEAFRAKPHGRMCWSLLLPGFTDPRWIDLSVMPLVFVSP